ncbi:hypothetical protein [Actinokineospora globicatena]|uniref:Glycosyltransferase family 29 (Sialyltransferase) n=1 Tax=Actinokineospora globicatena TaxID=103729 RepID=A0A9W6QLT3_9PSEU|nr:hypothetical protein [Actinokineospora globicatena]GLW91947.1 hypothetical protein Aglo03_27630 [Actinokineospora globicatena]
MNTLLTRSAAELAELLSSYARGRPPRTIAVVGNAPMPPCADRSAAVDAADLVIRMTSFTTDPAALGTRTDVVVLHRGVIASPHTFADYKSRLYLLVEPGRLHWEPEAIPDWWPADLGFVPVPNHGFTVALNALLGFDPATPTWSTTGTMATYLATELFPTARVLLTGTSIVDDPDQTTFPHAWGSPVAVTAEHRLGAEADLLRRWESTGRIEILR